MQFSVLYGAATAVNSCLDAQLGPDEVTPYRREHYLLLGAQNFIFRFLSPFCFLLIESHYTFSVYYKILTNYVDNYCILIG